MNKKINNFFKYIKFSLRSNFIYNKKGMDMPMNVIIIALILITVAIILLAVFTGMFKKEGSELDKKIRGLQDCDDDKVANMFDKCPCDQEIENCPSKEKLISCDPTPKCGPKK